MTEQATRKQSMQMAGVIAGALITFNTLFYIASRFYYDDKPLLEADANSVRLAFATLSVIIAAMAYGAALAPRLIGHGLAVLIGICSIIGAIAVFATGKPAVMGTTMLIAGGLAIGLAWRSWQHSRAAWAFLTALLAVYATVDFFGAPKVRNLLSIGLWHALIIPGVQIVAVIALAMLRGEYKER